MKIRHYASSWPRSLKILLNNEETTFFKLLELNKEFENDIYIIRKKYDIPKKGFHYDMEGKVGLGVPKYLDYDMYDQYFYDEFYIEDRYGFVGSWGLSLSYFIKYNYMPKMPTF